jgi:hypothetical protein
VTRRVSVIGVTLIVAMTASARAQQQTPSLGEVARQAEAAKATTKKAKKSYTNGDLKVDPTAPPPAPAAQPSTGYVSASLGKVVSPEELIERSKEVVDEKMGGRQPEDHWRKRADSIRMQIDPLQARMSILTKPNPARDDNPGAKARNDGEIAKVRQGLAGLMKQWATLEESARVANVPTAWLDPRPQLQP